VTRIWPTKDNFTADLETRLDDARSVWIGSTKNLNRHAQNAPARRDQLRGSKADRKIFRYPKAGWQVRLCAVCA